MHNFEQIGLIPRSIVRTFQRFIKQVGLNTDLFVLYEFRISRYIALASFQCFFFLIICPWVFQWILKFFLVNLLESLLHQGIFLSLHRGFHTPITSEVHLAQSLDRGIFLNFHQQERAFAQIQTFSQKMYFETLLKSFKMLHSSPAARGSILPAEGTWGAPDAEGVPLAPEGYLRHLGQVKKAFLADHSSAFLQKTYSSYFFKCANFYNKQSIVILTNWITDVLTLLFFICLLIFSTPQILILKTFCIESLLSLSETTKCFFLIFSLDLLVGFHSSKSWEIFLQFWIEHFGFQIHQNFIAFFISTFPVLLDTIFKYWIFRYLNKISPSTVATYQAMIE